MGCDVGTGTWLVRVVGVPGIPTQYQLFSLEFQSWLVLCLKQTGRMKKKRGEGACVVYLET